MCVCSKASLQQEELVAAKRIAERAVLGDTSDTTESLGRLEFDPVQKEKPSERTE